MTSLTPGANATLSAGRLVVSLGLGDAVEPAALLLSDAERVRSDRDFVTAHGPPAPGLSWTRSGNGDWQLDVALSEVPGDVHTVRVAGTLLDSGRVFADLGPVTAWVRDMAGNEQASFAMSGLGSETSLIVLEIYRRQDTWKVRAVGQGYAGGRAAMLADAGVDPAAVPAVVVIPQRTGPVPTPEPDSVVPASAGIRYERADRRRSAPAPAPSPRIAAVFEPLGVDRPAPAGPTPLWDLVERPRPGHQPVRPVRWDTTATDFTWCERVRDLLPDSETLPDGIDKFTVAEQWARQLHAQRGAGFEYTWRTPDDRQLNPAWLTLKSALVDPATGRVVATGHLTHGNFGTSPAYDLGTINGSNGLSWPTRGHTDGLVYPTHCLYVGSTRTGVLAPVDSTSNTGSVDYDPATGTIATLEQLGNSGCLSVYDAGTGTRRRLTMLDRVGGGEPVRFSFDGKWLLVPRFTGSYLCEVATGRLVTLPVDQCCWWPGADSVLLTIPEVDGRYVPRLFSLASGDYVHDFPALRFPSELDPGVDYAAHPEVSPDGTQLLVLTPVGVSAEHRGEHAVGGHLARVTLADGVGRLVQPAVLDTPFPADRDVSEGRWSGPYPYRTVTLAPELAAQLQPPDTTSSYLAPGRYADEAEELLVKTLNRAINLFQQDEDFAHLMPEIVMSLITVHEDPEIWERRYEFVAGLVTTLAKLAEDGTLTGRDFDAWLSFSVTVVSLSTTGSSSVSPTTAAWIEQ